MRSRTKIGQTFLLLDAHRVSLIFNTSNYHNLGFFDWRETVPNRRGGGGEHANGIDACAMKKDNDRRVISTNRRARFEYELSDTWEAGLILLGSEVKSLRRAGANLDDAWVGLDSRGRLELLGAHIAPYLEANRFNHEPTRTRPLLLHKLEILRLRQKVRERGYTLVPLQLYFEGRWCKLEFALGRGKRLHDKRQSTREAEDRREIQRALRDRG